MKLCALDARAFPSQHYSTSSKVNVVEWLVSMPTVQVVIGSALTISFGLASRDYTSDSSAFRGLLKKARLKVWDLLSEFRFRFWFYIWGLVYI